MSSTTSLDDISDAIQGLATHIDERFQQVDERFQQVDERFQQVDERFQQVDGRLNSIDNRLSNLEQQHREMREWLESVDNRLSGIESDVAGIYDRIVALEKKGKKYLTQKDITELENQFAALFDWAQKVSKHTGIALPKLK